jgi:hypothetical protein
MQPTRRGFRITLLAGVSVVALAAASTHAAAVLFGERQVQRTATATTATGSVASITMNNSDNAAVFNLDAQAGLSYWINPV